MNEKLIELVGPEIDRLVTLGEKLMRAASGSDSRLGAEFISQAAFWVTSSGQLIRKIYVNDNQHFESYKRILKDNDFSNVHSNYFGHVCEL
jgi:hypothetical protein